MDDQGIELYIGETVSHNSERKFLTKLDAYIKKTDISCLVFANFELKERQVDFVVLTPSEVQVVDAKFASKPIRGEINGAWQHQLPDGQWSHYTNAYQQVLNCKNRLRNAMGNMPEKFYPDGSVVFVDNIPKGSTLTEGNFKVWVTDLSGFFGKLDSAKNNPWALEKWREFATRLKLTKVQLHEAFDDSDSDLLLKYRTGFIHDYRLEADRWIPENDSQADDILATTKNGIGCFINGPSGCGKTLAAKHLGVELSKEGAIVFFISATTFNGSLSNALRTEVSLVSDLDYRSLIKALSSRGVTSYFIVDGLNEMSEKFTNITLRGLKALARRYNSKIIATSQLTPPASLVALEVFEVSEPSLNLKQRIAESASAKLRATAIQVLPVVNSGLEAKIIGEIQSKLANNATRLNLLDQYMRHLLGKNARRGASLLRYFASWLMDKTAFSISETEFDIQMTRNGFSLDDCDALFDANILIQRGGRVSFVHEMYYYACASHEYTFTASSDPKSVGKTLNTPVYRPLASDVISAIETESACIDVLKYIVDANLLTDAADGKLGRTAERAAQKLLKDALDQVLSDIESARLNIWFHDKIWHVGWNVSVKTEFLPEERAQYQAIGLRAARGACVEEYLSLCRSMDQRLSDERFLLQEQARDNKIALRSESFRLTYLAFGSGISFSIVAGSTKNNFAQKQNSIFSQQRKLSVLSSGELYFFLEHSQFSDNRDEEWFAEELIEIIANKFRYEPYHVKLSILHNAGLVGNVSLNIINRLISEIETIDTNSLGWFGSTAIIDALRSLGAFEKQAETERKAIRKEIKTATEGIDDKSAFEHALGVYGATYDHPFDWIFCEEIYELPPNLLHKIYRRALQAPNIKQSFSLAMLIDEVAQFDEVSDAHIFSQFAKLPSKDSVFPQNETAAHVLAVRFLARHQRPLPTAEISDDYDRCFAAFRKIIYAQQLQTSEARLGACSAWQALEIYPPQIVISCFQEIVEAISYFGGRNYPELSKAYPTINLLEIYPAEILRLTRSFIARSEPAKKRQGFDDDTATSYAFHIIGKYGDRGDLAILRDLINSPKLADNALSAIKFIEGSGI